MQFQSYKIADLIPASYNPRKKLKPGDKEYEKIKNFIKEFGYVEPIIINSDMTIIGGHQRATVLADLGYTEVECIVVDIDKTKEKINEFQARLRDLEKQKTELENTEIVEAVRGIDIPLNDLPAVLKALREQNGAPFTSGQVGPKSTKKADSEKEENE